MLFFEVTSLIHLRFFFFSSRRRHTRFSRDWSSDVCSSDLRPRWDALGAWRLVVEAPESVTVAAIHPGAEVLAGIPRSDLLTTARVLLDNGGDAVAAARALH